MILPVPSAPIPFVVIDASVWISGVLKRDANYARARTWIRQHIASGKYLVAPLLLVVETGATISRVTQNQTLARQTVLELSIFPHLQLEPMGRELIDEATDIAITFGLRGADSLYVAVAKRLAIPLVTLDHEQLTRPASIITTISP